IMIAPSVVLLVRWSWLFVFSEGMFLLFFFFFFFQAEDGIRDATVTGVQTCALPISSEHASQGRQMFLLSCLRSRRKSRTAQLPRSEERRVGKECRSRRWADE